MVSLAFSSIDYSCFYIVISPLIRVELGGHSLGLAFGVFSPRLIYRKLDPNECLRPKHHSVRFRFDFSLFLFVGSVKLSRFQVFFWGFFLMFYVFGFCGLPKFPPFKPKPQRTPKSRPDFWKKWIFMFGYVVLAFLDFCPPLSRTWQSCEYQRLLNFNHPVSGL